MHQISFISSSKIRKIISILVLGVLVISGTIFLQGVTMRDNSGFKYRPFFEEDTEYDVMFFGTSHVINGIFPMQLWNDYGITSYNFGGHANSIATSYWTMVNAVKYHKPKIAVLDVLGAQQTSPSMDISNAHLTFDVFPMTMTKIAAIRDIFPDDRKKQSELLFPFSIYHNRWNEIGPNMVKSALGIHESSSKEKGAESRMKVDVPMEMRLINKNERMEDDTLGLQYIQKFITFCNENGIVPLIINIPYPASEGDQKAANAAVMLAKRQNVNAINFQYMDTVDFDTDCYDKSSHLNPSGARKVTDYLGSYLISHYDLSDHRKEPQYNCWKDDYKEYYSYLVDNIKSHDDYKEMLMLLNNENFRAKLEVTKDYEPDKVERKLENQLGKNLYIKKVSKVETEQGEEGTVRLTVYNAKNNEEIVSKVYKEKSNMMILKDE